MSYKISGEVTQSGTVYVIQNNNYIGYKNINSGNYNVVFNSDNGNDIIAICENDVKETLSYGGITAVSSGDSVNITSLATGAAVKSIQHLSIDTTGVYTINSVDMSKTILLVNLRGIQCNPYGYNIFRTRLTSSTEVSVDIFAVAKEITVMEFESGVNVQRGLITVNTGDLYVDHTITSVDTSKASCVWLGNSCSGSDGRQCIISTKLLDSTTIRAERELSGQTASVSYEVIEFI